MQHVDIDCWGDEYYSLWWCIYGWWWWLFMFLFGKLLADLAVANDRALRSSLFVVLLEGLCVLCDG
jgi:hypothetical protein